jgi:hypothetical protein
MRNYHTTVDRAFEENEYIYLTLIERDSLENIGISGHCESVCLDELLKMVVGSDERRYFLNKDQSNNKRKNSTNDYSYYMNKTRENLFNNTNCIKFDKKKLHKIN